MFNGKMKALTFSYDDGVDQDKRLIEIFNKYGLKATFNINSGKFGIKDTIVRNGRSVCHDRISECDICRAYEGHEVAAHTLTHPNLTTVSDEVIAYEVEEDRKRLSALLGYEVVGMAYPGGGVNNNEHVAEVVADCSGVRYARTTTSTYAFTRQDDLMRFNPSVYYNDNRKSKFENFDCKSLIC
jgi:peptidoglycan/xylan/chitin deacetylase (PgdA/CDA1 family)